MMGCGDEDTPGYMMRAVLHDECAKRGCSLAEVARILGVSRPFLSGTIHGHNRLSTSLAVRMHNRLGWPALDYLQAQASMEFEAEWQRQHD